MSNSVSIGHGIEWGDEGKGKGSHYLSAPGNAERTVSVRALGGGNAGHTIITNARKYALHLLPAGCLHDDVELVLGRGMVTHLGTLLGEIDTVNDQAGTDPASRLHIAAENHILFDGHKLADKELERRRGANAIGTTHSGIGPAIADKSLRVGMRMESLRLPKDKLQDEYLKLTRHWQATYGVQMDGTTSEKEVATLLDAKEKLEGKIVPNMTSYWRDVFKNDYANVFIEGAQGYELNIDGSGYPFVTSSAISIDGHMHGAQLSSKRLTSRMGFMKAYTTRVGGGPFPTEIHGEEADHIQTLGGERGATTGRLRRVGWSDITRIDDVVFNEGLDALAIMKMDILDDRDVIPVCVGYQNGEPVYENLPGWKQSTRGITKFEDLPENAQNYLRFFEQRTGVKATLVGTGPEDVAMIDRR